MSNHSNRSHGASHNTDVYGKEHGYPYIYPSIPGETPVNNNPPNTEIPAVKPVDDGKGNYVKVNPSPYNAVVKDSNHQNTTQPSPYHENNFPTGHIQDPTQRRRPAELYNRNKSRLICNWFHASTIMFAGVILWVISVIGYAISNQTINEIAAALNFLSYVLILTPSFCCHPCCDHDDHSCCYGEYD
jgi:hypothetical protein